MSRSVESGGDIIIHAYKEFLFCCNDFISRIDLTLDPEFEILSNYSVYQITNVALRELGCLLIFVWQLTHYIINGLCFTQDLFNRECFVLRNMKHFDLVGSDKL
jgi:hypothetical protein